MSGTNGARRYIPDTCYKCRSYERKLASKKLTKKCMVECNKTYWVVKETEGNNERDDKHI